MTEIFALHGFTGHPRDFDVLAEHPNNVAKWTGISYTQSFYATDNYPLAFEKIGQQIENALQSSSAERKVLLGYSQGGRIALQYALANPSVIDALVLVGAFIGYASEREKKIRAEQDKQWASLLREQGLEAFLERWAKHPLIQSQQNISPVQKEFLRENKKLLTPKEIEACLLAISPAYMPYLLPLLSKSTCPILYLSGSDDSKFQKIGTLYREANPAIHTATIPHAGHACHLENPTDFLAELHTFLDSDKE